MTLEQYSWMVTLVTGTWLFMTVAFMKKPNVAIGILDTVALLATMAAWVWYALATEQCAFIALIILSTMAIFGVYDVNNKS